MNFGPKLEMQPSCFLSMAYCLNIRLMTDQFHLQWSTVHCYIACISSALKQNAKICTCDAGKHDFHPSSWGIDMAVPFLVLAFISMLEGSGKLAKSTNQIIFMKAADIEADL